jgi:hypothetical protein
MHPQSNPSDDRDDLPAPGERWGRGASSVLPYLTKSLRSKPAEQPEGSEARSNSAHPVFSDWPPGRRPE